LIKSILCAFTFLTLLSGHCCYAQQDSTEQWIDYFTMEFWYSRGDSLEVLNFGIGLGHNFKNDRFSLELGISCPKFMKFRGRNDAYYYSAEYIYGIGISGIFWGMMEIFPDSSKGRKIIQYIYAPFAATILNPNLNYNLDKNLRCSIGLQSEYSLFKMEKGLFLRPRISLGFFAPKGAG
jgi:hypothetical protein